MSSNIRLPKICQHCGEEFIAKTTVTKYCGDRCAKRAYKKRKRDEKIGVSQEETKVQLNLGLEQIKAKEFLTASDAAKLLNCSTVTIYNLIKNGTLKAVNLGIRKTLIKRSSIDELFS